MLIVATYRDSELHDQHPLADLLASLRREERIERISLRGLDTDAIVELLRAISRQEPTPDAVELARLLQRDTDGNPLFVAEVLRDLLEQGYLARGDDGVWTITTAIEKLPTPASVRDVVTQRVQRLGQEAQQVLVTAAVIGRDFELDVLAELLDEQPADLLAEIEQAMAASLVSETPTRPGTFRFIHALIAQALVDGLSAARRSQLHQRIAMTIEELHGPELGDRVASVAGHLLAAGDDHRKTIDYARRAGTHALAALAPEEALRWFRTAFGLLERTGLVDPELACDLSTDIGEAMRDAGQPGARDQLVSAAQAARALHDRDRLTRAIFAMNRSIATSVGTADHELIATMESAVELCDRPDADRARLLSQLAAELLIIGTLDRRKALVEEALAIARDLDDLTLARVIVSSLSAYFTTAAFPERQALLDELGALLPSISDPQIAGYAAIHGVWISLEAADPIGVAQAIDDARRTCVESGQPTLTWLLAQQEAVVARINGDLDAAEAHALAGLELATAAGLQDGFIYYATQTIAQRFADGRTGEYLDLVQEALASNPTVTGSLRGALGVALIDVGRLDEASALLDQGLTDDFGMVPNSHPWAMILDLVAQAAHRVSRTDVAARLLELFEPMPEVMLVTGPNCSVHVETTRGLLETTLGRHDAADAHFRRASEVLESFAPLPYARNLYEHGRALLELGDPDDGERARRLLTRAATSFERLGLAVRMAQCEELLAKID